MKLKLLFIIIVSVIFLSASCEREDEDCHKAITFINNSDKLVYVIFDTSYPDTIYFGHGPSPSVNPMYMVPAKTSSKSPLQDRSCWEAIIAGARIPSDTLMVFVFDGETINNTDWSDVVHNYLVEKRYDLSINDLIKNEWIIEYP